MADESIDSARRGQVIIEGDYATVVFKRVLRHRPEHVWEAITNPNELKEWLMCSSAKIDGRTGGEIEMVAGPAQFHVTGKILVWEPPCVFEHEWIVAPTWQMPKGENAIFRYELSPQGDDTLLTVTYRKLTRATAGGFAPGTHVLLDRLEAQLDDRSLPDWMPRFETLLKLYPEWKK
jgi:uncharacterized protein YndB with AHSA1/START domain